MRHFNILLLLTPLSIFAATLGGPVAGYATFANGSELRVILGTPGAYRFSDPLPLPDGATRVHPAPGRDFALVERSTAGDAGDAAPGIAVFNAGAIESFTALTGAVAAPDWVAFSSEGTAMVLYSSGANRMQVWSGLPGSAQLSLDVAADSLPQRPITAALSEDGQTVLVASRSAVYLVPTSGTPRLILSAGLIASVTMLRNGQDAAVADRAAGSLQIVHDVSGTADVRILASGLEDAGAMYPSSDGASLYMAIPSLKSIAAIDLGSGAVDTFDAGAAPLSLSRLRNRDTFLISSKRGQPGWVFFRADAAGAGSGKTVFIPAVPRSQEVQQ